MNIKTITCHKVYNYGATLQEYALLRYLGNIGHEAMTINYTPHYLSNHFNLLSVSNPKYNKNVFVKALYLLAKLPQRLISLQRKKAFDIFEKKYVPTTKTSYKSNKELKENLPIADIYICGSDQIWNSFFQNGKDPAFYLDFVPEDKLKISYAASFAIDEIEDALKPFVKEKVNKINKISVRETSGINILNKLGITKVTQVLDPVFLLPASYWKENFINSINEQFVFVYDFDSNLEIKKLAKKIAKDYHLKIFTINQNINFADKNYFLKGPKEFLSLIYHAKFILTNSFHAVAFSVIFKKTFFVFDRKEKINTRMRDLLKLFNLEEYLISEEKESQQLKKIDYIKINKLKQQHIQKSKQFLKKALTL